MRHKNRIIVFFCFFCLAGFLFQGCSKPAGRNEYPVNDITVICPWVQGGGTDMVLRALCESAESRLGVKINIVNRAGENGALGFEAIRDASTDGYTIGMITYSRYFTIFLNTTSPSDLCPSRMSSSSSAGTTLTSFHPV